MTTFTAETADHKSLLDHFQNHLDKPQLAELGDLLLHSYCKRHRDVFISGAAAADCAECCRHLRVRNHYNAHAPLLIMALIVNADEYDGSGITAESVLINLVADLARVADIDVEL